MANVNLKATIDPVVPAGTPSPLRIQSNSALRASSINPLPNLANDLENIMQTVNRVFQNQQTSPSLSQLLLTNAAGEVIAAFGPTVYKGAQYINYLSEIHVGDPLQTKDPAKALFNATADGAVSIGQNGWLDVHDPFDGNAAWIGTQFDTTTVTGATNNGAGLIRLLVPGHTLVTGNTAAVRNMNLFHVPNANGTWTVTLVDASNVDLQGSVWAGTFAPPTDIPTGIPTYQPTIDRVLQISSVTNAGGLFRIATSIPHSYESGQEVNIPAPGPGGTPNAVGQWIIKKITSTTFDLYTLSNAASTFAGAYTSGGTVLAYNAGILAETFAIGPSFQNYNLRAFATGDLRIRNATIELTATGGGIVLDPANGQIILSATGSLAKIVLDATVPEIRIYNNAGVLSASLSSNGVISGTLTPSGPSYTGTAVVRNAAGTSTSSFAVVNGIITGFTP